MGNDAAKGRGDMMALYDPRIGHICATSGACECSSSGEECCCFYLEGELACRSCGAPIVLIDMETGEQLTVSVVLD